MDAEKKVEDPPPTKNGTGRQRAQSTIEFPYLDLENAMEIASGVHAVGGSGCDWDRLAAHFKQAAQGGGFRLRLISAKTFGLVTYDRGKISLTALGLRIVDPQQQRAAKVEAFLNVPLYKAVYDKFGGGALPPNPGLEQAMTDLGVAPKQADKARQTFQRSAKHAGFFDFGPDRLVMPSIGSGGGQTDREKPSGPPDVHAGDGGSNGGSGAGLHPFIQGLLQKLPEPETTWAIEARAKWLTTAMNIFDLMYTTADDAGNKFIAIEVKQQ
ncbi:hypothetical protein [Caldimonas thermodepolymerans]|jgi:hypothetical protein|uniref:hypothetical protein n=1 Tax=Caldimonas thermodepolymerans TaxID=215580 RepID=UPI0024910234|nr:hypothetical protein [Caldimonas thermodepolymerans]